MNENDLIAKYVKEKCPEILDTQEFALFKAKKIMIETAKQNVEKLNELVIEIHDKLKPQIDIKNELFKGKVEHKGCEGCKYASKSIYEHPCSVCKQNYVDRYKCKY